MAWFPPAENLDFSHPELWPEWKQRFHRFGIGTKLDKDSEEVQVYSAVFTGERSEQVVKTFTHEEEGRQKQV